MDDVLSRLLDKVWDKFLGTPENSRFCKPSSRILPWLYQLTNVASNRHWRHPRLWYAFPSPNSTPITTYTKCRQNNSLQTPDCRPERSTRVYLFGQGPCRRICAHGRLPYVNPDCFCPFLVVLEKNNMG